MKITLRERVEPRLVSLLPYIPNRLKLLLAGGRRIVVDGDALDVDTQLVLAIRRRRQRYGFCEPDVPTARARLRHEAALFRGPVTPVGAVRDVELDVPHTLRARHYAPPTNVEQPLLVYFHGGGFSICDLDTHDELGRLLCVHANMHVLSVDYRLAPEHPFPAALDDARAALQWAQQHAASLGADPSQVCMGGDSAGANLTIVTARELGKTGPFAQLLFYPPTDAVRAFPSKAHFDGVFLLNLKDCDDFRAAYLGASRARPDDPRVSPAFFTDLSGMPRALIVTAGFDVLRDEGEAFAETLRKAGNRIEVIRARGMVHGFTTMTNVVPAAKAATIEAARRFRSLVDE